VGKGETKERRREMRADQQDVLKRLNYIEGHIGGIRKMVEQDKYCVDILRQTYAVRKAIEKLETLILEQHLHTCVPEGIREGKEEAVISELVQLYNLAANR
jgi:CsoR family transcriptional regulator, copper-sensing transcriptional repressor